jgi:hypothetical protein
VHSLVTSKCKKKLLKEPKIVNNQQESLEAWIVNKMGWKIYWMLSN